MPNQPTVSIGDAVKRFRDGESVFELHVPELVLDSGRVTVVAGRSGCGKTTLLDVLGCISDWSECRRFECSAGGRTLDMLHTGERNKAQMRRLNLGYVLQQGGLLGFLTAWENILLPLRMSGRMQLASEARQLAERLGVAAELEKLPQALSLGQRQRVSVVRALATRPALLLADEPTGALDPLTAQEVSRCLVDVARQQGTTVVVVTHDVELFAPDADRQMGFDITRDGHTVRSILVPFAGGERRLIA